MISKLLGVVGAASLLVASGAASAQTAEALSVAHSPAARAGAELSSPGEIRGSARWILGAIALGLLIWGALELLDDGTNAVPASP